MYETAQRQIDILDNKIEALKEVVESLTDLVLGLRDAFELKEGLDMELAEMRKQIAELYAFIKE